MSCDCVDGSPATVETRDGDSVCSRCGVVVSRIISQDAEYRVFSNDPSSYEKARVHGSYNPFDLHTSLGDCPNRWNPDPNQFLQMSLRQIKDVMNRMYQDEPDHRVLNEALSLCQLMFHRQYLEKQGTDSRIVETGDSVRFEHLGRRTPRKNYSRRYTMVVSCIWAAHRRLGNRSKEIDYITSFLDGGNVTHLQVKHFLTDHGMFPKSHSWYV